jgi:transcriptional regulator with XRE-family HTH domain
MDATKFSSNLKRLLGIHDLTYREAAKLTNMSYQAYTSWAQGGRTPSFKTALVIGEFFGVPANRLAEANFEDLLEHELSDPERYRQVEARIKKARSRLQLVREGR